MIQRKYKRTENEKIKKRVSDYARKKVIEQTSSDESDEHSSSNINEIKNDKPKRDSSYNLENNSMQEYDEDKIVHEIESSQKQSLQMKLKEMEKKLKEIDLQEQAIGSTRKHCDEKYDRVNETKRKNKQYLTDNCSKSKTVFYESDTEGKSQRKTSLTKPVVLSEKYNGEGVWEDYKQNFEACATVNGWSKKQKAQFSCS